MKKLLHIAFLALCVLLALLLPYRLFIGPLGSLFSALTGGVDAVTSASVATTPPGMPATV